MEKIPSLVPDRAPSHHRHRCRGHTTGETTFLSLPRELRNMVYAYFASPVEISYRARSLYLPYPKNINSVVEACDYIGRELAQYCFEYGSVTLLGDYCFANSEGYHDTVDLFSHINVDMDNYLFLQCLRSADTRDQGEPCLADLPPSRHALSHLKRVRTIQYRARLSQPKGHTFETPADREKLFRYLKFDLAVRLPLVLHKLVRVGIVDTETNVEVWNADFGKPHDQLPDCSDWLMAFE